jgi:hypothetical protein
VKAKKGTSHITLYKRGDRDSYFDEFFNCTDVENDGPVLSFVDEEGNFHKTTVPWWVFKGPEKKRPR